MTRKLSVTSRFWQTVMHGETVKIDFSQGGHWAASRSFPSSGSAYASKRAVCPEQFPDGAPQSNLGSFVAPQRRELDGSSPYPHPWQRASKSVRSLVLRARRRVWTGKALRPQRW